MEKVIELTNVYLEYNDELEETPVEETQTKEVVNTTTLSIEELQQKLEETQGLRL